MTKPELVAMILSTLLVIGWFIYPYLFEKIDKNEDE